MGSCVCEAQEKALNVMVDIHYHIYKLKCENKSQVQMHLETLTKMQEQLAGMGVGLPNNDFVTVILGSLPKSYRPLINAISMSVTHAKVSLEPDKVIESLLDEFERLGIEEHQLKASENALVAVGGCGKSCNKKGSSSTQKPDHTDVECWKCGQKGHIQKNCCSKKKKKEGSSKDKDTANTATGGNKFAFTTTFIGAVLTRDSNPLAKLETDVYDSGASSHMSPARDHFTSFMAITPKPIKAADQTIFIATAMGDLWISIPNGMSMTAITLKGVLYFPELAFTLVSLTQWDIPHCSRTANVLSAIHMG